MTALNIATDIPSGIATLEELVMWSLNALHYINPDLESIEGPGYIEQAAQANVYPIPADSNHKFIGRCSIVVNPDYFSGSQRPWKYALPMSNTPLPAEFKTN